MKYFLPLLAGLLFTSMGQLHADEPLRLSDGRPAPAYSVIAKLAPKKAEGFFMAPALVKMPSGTLVAGVPVGQAYPEGGRGLRTLRFYQSKDGGKAWKQVCELPYDSCEPNLLVHEGKLYLLITPNGNNAKLERSHFPRDGKWSLWAAASDDEGATWSPITRVLDGLAPPGKSAPMLNTGGQTAMVIKDGKLYLSVSDQFEMLAAASCRLDQGILNPRAWRISEMVELPIPREVAHPSFQGKTTRMRVLEGNVVEVSGRLLVIARAIINGGGTANLGAVFEIIDRPGESLRLEFLQLYPIPGGQLKFYIVHDSMSRLYWMASNLPSNPAFVVQDEAWRRTKELNASPSDRRSLLLWYSVDALNWFPAGWVARAQGWTQAFHYPVLLIDGDDLLLISRTGLESGNQHDVDLATFHRITNFRKLAVDLTPTFEEPGK
jgi:hypothetical protein